MCCIEFLCFFFSSRRRHTRCALVTGVQTCALPILWKKGAKVFGSGPEIDLTYKVEWLGDDASLVAKLPQAVLDALKGAERPMLIFGGGALSVPGVHGAALALAKSVNAVKDGWNGFNVVHFSAARMGALMLGYSQPGGIGDIVAAKPKLAFFLGADAVAFSDFSAPFKV